MRRVLARWSQGLNNWAGDVDSMISAKPIDRFPRVRSVNKLKPIGHLQILFKPDRAGHIQLAVGKRMTGPGEHLMPIRCTIQTRIRNFTGSCPPQSHFNSSQRNELSCWVLNPTRHRPSHFSFQIIEQRHTYTNKREICNLGSALL